MAFNIERALEERDRVRDAERDKVIRAEVVAATVEAERAWMKNAFYAIKSGQMTEESFMKQLYTPSLREEF